MKVGILKKENIFIYADRFVICNHTILTMSNSYKISFIYLLVILFLHKNLLTYSYKSLCLGIPFDGAVLPPTKTNVLEAPKGPHYLINNYTVIHRNIKTHLPINRSRPITKTHKSSFINLTQYILLQLHVTLETYFYTSWYSHTLNK
jgi:hypothetical protein